MKDKIKTLLLLVLFCMSIFLSRHLWLSDLNSFAKVEENVDDIEINRDIIKPYKALLNFSRKNHTIIYKGNGLWEASKDYISKAFSSKSVSIDTIDLDDYTEYLKKKSVVFHFPQRVNTYLLAKSLDVENANYVTEDIPKVEYVYLNLSEKEQFIVIGYDDKLFKVSDFSTDIKEILLKLKDVEKEGNYTNYYSAKETMGINSPLYIAYNMSEHYPSVYISSSDDLNYIKSARRNSETFFDKDIDYIREVIEDNGSILHIYNQEVLKYTKDGSIEYFNPLQESIRERNLSISLQRTSEFLKEHIDSGDDLYLSSLKEIEFKGNLGYRFIFRYNIEGLELLEIEGKNDHIYIDVYNNYVQSYKKSMETSMVREYLEDEPISPFTILNDNYDLFNDDYLKYNEVKDLSEDEIATSVFESFNDISIYYISIYQEDGSVLKPIWLFSNRNIEYMFDFYSGDLIYKRKIE